MPYALIVGPCLGAGVGIELHLSGALNKHRAIGCFHRPLPLKRDDPLRAGGVMPTADVTRRQHRIGDTFDFIGRHTDPLRLGGWCVTFKLQSLNATVVHMSGALLIGPDRCVLDRGLKLAVTGGAF
ncbi:hypothetical protein NZ708_06605 [Pseudomonas syringae pv. actinidiae ICMP 18708]|uniref:Asparagine N-glycosylation enzyme n=1 Tax=Pseudomonas syringae pv. actinidiae TaxID=103796 RepID=A0AAN4TJW5_PSESF|nr:hypothetical protein IYO_006610 [Pseudomonas syringae pv. actinidiae ICMP 18884]AOE55686.1 hypothetical protein NZ708_06605 [Pseudomonas syringae pv. actinidiae ICMP 18708]APP96545.1 hypothetical protein PsaNZ45_06605 [Pseudomonas syringae pv. actinidiae]EPN71571.1 hypothetical protein A235_02316 [Pseudomonas syringae pv. actinidiae ICMP 19079]EPN75768.1 hypothetical protein A221_26695 [Pseudomonas syringae pv. actinidiae ICMP 18801]EPN81560.1 hypothetical protein A233_01846 [Pseudomonas sy